MFELGELYDNIDSESNPAKLKRFIDDSAVIDYVDTNESDTVLIALDEEAYKFEYKKIYTFGDSSIFYFWSFM